MKTITITSMKGGCAKTTSVSNLIVSGALKCPKKRFLLVDFDPQGNLSMTAGLESEPERYSDEILQGRPVVPTPTALPNVCIIPARKVLAEVADSGVLSRINWHLIFKRALEPIQDQFDYCFVDTPATFGKLHTVALCASDGYILSMRPDAYSFLGFDDARQEVEKMKAEFGSVQPEFLGSFLSGVPRSRRRAVERIREGLKEEGDNLTLTFEIPLDQQLDEVRWEDGPGFKTIHRVRSGVGDVLEAYEWAWKMISKSLEVVHA